MADWACDALSRAAAVLPGLPSGQCASHKIWLPAATIIMQQEVAAGCSVLINAFGMSCLAHAACV